MPRASWPQSGRIAIIDLVNEMKNQHVFPTDTDRCLIIRILISVAVIGDGESENRFPVDRGIIAATGSVRLPRALRRRRGVV